MKWLVIVVVPAAIVIGFLVYRSHASRDRFDVDPHAAQEIEKVLERGVNNRIWPTNVIDAEVSHPLDLLGPTASAPAVPTDFFVDAGFGCVKYRRECAL